MILELKFKKMKCGKVLYWHFLLTTWQRMSSEDLRNHFPLRIGFVAHAWQRKMSLKPISEKVSLHLEIHYHTQIMDGPDSVKSSIEYGVNRRSLLDELPYFSVVKAKDYAS